MGYSGPASLASYTNHLIPSHQRLNHQPNKSRHYSNRHLQWTTICSFANHRTDVERYVALPWMLGWQNGHWLLGLELEHGRRGQCPHDQTSQHVGRKRPREHPVAPSKTRAPLAEAAQHKKLGQVHARNHPDLGPKRQVRQYKKVLAQGHAVVSQPLLILVSLPRDGKDKPCPTLRAPSALYFRR